MAEKMVTIMDFEAEDQAQYYLERLENAGITATLIDDRVQEGGVPETDPLPDLGGRVLMQVPETLALEAEQILEETYEEGTGDNPAVQS